MARFCGTRYAGGVYLVAEPDKIEELYNMGLMNFVVDPPEPIYDPAAVGISMQGQSFLEIGYKQDGTPIEAMFDWVGGSYPAVSDFVQEFLAMGPCNRMRVDLDRPKNFLADLDRIKKVDWMCYVHPRACITTELARFYEERVLLFGKPCVKDIPEHIAFTKDNPGMCAALWWEDVPNDSHNTAANKGPRTVKRHGGDTTYNCATTPKGIKPEHVPGIFLRVPMKAYGLEIVFDEDQRRHDKIVDLLKNVDKDIPFKVVNE
jgi:hypothetical protein